MEAQEIQQKVLHTMRGELALLVAVLINSFGVVLMLHSGAGISAISSVPFAFSEVFTRISLGTWTYLFQGVLVLSLMILRKRFVPQYLFSFVVGFVFGELLDVHEAWINLLPLTLPNRRGVASFRKGCAWAGGHMLLARSSSRFAVSVLVGRPIGDIPDTIFDSRSRRRPSSGGKADRFGFC